MPRNGIALQEVVVQVITIQVERLVQEAAAQKIAILEKILTTRIIQITQVAQVFLH